MERGVEARANSSRETNQKRHDEISKRISNDGRLGSRTLKTRRWAGKIKRKGPKYSFIGALRCQKWGWRVMGSPGWASYQPTVELKSLLPFPTAPLTTIGTTRGYYYTAAVCCWPQSAECTSSVVPFLCAFFFFRCFFLFRSQARCFPPGLRRFVRRRRAAEVI